MTMVFLSWLGLLFFFLVTSPINSLSALPSSHFPSELPLCHPHESSALLHFRDSFYLSYRASPINSTLSWNVSRDCCTWSGVTCDEVSGHVVRLDLKGSGLQGAIHSNSSLFLLTHLQSLVLSQNSFFGSGVSPQFGSFVSLIHLDLSESSITGQVPLEFSFLSSLVTLDLSWNSDLNFETFSLKRIVANLTSLKELRLSYVDLSFVSPNSFMNLSTSLTSLDLSISEIKGEFPENIFHLPKLQKLDLSYNIDLNGSFPRYNWSSTMRDLNLSGTGFLLDFCHLAKTFKSLNSLGLSSIRFRGSDLAFLGNLTQITSLGLSRNDIGGQFPWSSLNLEKLTYIYLHHNKFTGELPEICSSSTNNTFSCDSAKEQLVGVIPLNLKSLYLNDNLLNGSIPSWLYSLPHLQVLDLSRNQFTGHIDEFQYSSLVSLGLASNKLQGFIPRSIFHLVNLSRLDLSSNNLSGSMRLDQSSNLKNLWDIDLSSNSLSMDSINFIISALPNTLLSLSLSSCSMREIPHSLKGFENLDYLDLSNNQIEGIVPQWFWNVGTDPMWYLNISHNLLTHMEQNHWKHISIIDLSSNRLQGHLPIPPPSTVLFSISNNLLIGEISFSFCNLTMVDTLDLSNNNLTGSIPPCSGLSALALLMILNLHGNQLEGSLPNFLQDCKNLEILDVGNNMLSGSFPHWLASLPQLQVVILRSNRFHGPISSLQMRFPFQKLRIMDLSNNEFTGLLPAEYFENFMAMMDAYSDVLEYMGLYPGGGSYYYSVTMTIKGNFIELQKIQEMFITIDLSSNNCKNPKL